MNSEEVWVLRTASSFASYRSQQPLAISHSLRNSSFSAKRWTMSSILLVFADIKVKKLSIKDSKKTGSPKSLLFGEEEEQRNECRGDKKIVASDM